MKKLKLLSSLSALLLVLSVGACNNNVTEDSSSDEVTSSESDSSTSSSETTPTVVELSNYTISITLLDEEGNTVAIPFYDSVYIQGSWDSWAEWVPLTNIGSDDEPILTTTFASLEEGTYEFKGLIGLTDSGDPDWVSGNWIELIVAEDGTHNATFTVNAEDGDNYTNNLEFTVDASKVPVLEETPMDDETIAGLILAQVKEIYEEPWEAIHGYSKEDDEMSVEVWYTSDENDGTYGKAIWYDDGEEDETRYIVDGTQYIIDGDGEYSTQTYSNEYEDEFDTYAVATDTLGSAAASDATITHEEGSSIYTLTVVDDDTTDVAVAQRAGDVFTVISVLESEEDEEYFAEEITAAEVEAIIDAVDFGPWIYETDEDPVAAMFEAIGDGQNYTLTIEYYDRMTDFYETNTAAQAAWSAGERYSQDIYVDITYTQDAVLMEYYDSWLTWYLGYPFDVELYVNDEEALKVYWMGDDDLYLVEDYFDDEYQVATWQDNFYTVLDLVSGGFPAAFNMGQTTLGSYGPETDYSFTQILANENNLYYFIECLFKGGNYMGDYLDGPYYLQNYIGGAQYYYSGYYAGAATYYADYGELDVEIQTAAITWNYGSYGYLVESNYMCASIYNVGESEIPEEYASYLQA